jgi:RNA polymerase sigma-54 factor
MRELIEEYNGEKKLSDQKISEMLKNKGINIARRTVAKYRGELNIDSSYTR